MIVGVVAALAFSCGVLMLVDDLLVEVVHVEKKDIVARYEGAVAAGTASPGQVAKYESALADVMDRETKRIVRAERLAATPDDALAELADKVKTLLDKPETVTQGKLLGVVNKFRGHITKDNFDRIMIAVDMAKSKSAAEAAHKVLAIAMGLPKK